MRTNLRNVKTWWSISGLRIQGVVKRILVGILGVYSMSLGAAPPSPL